MKKKQIVKRKKKFKLALKNGVHIWNIYRVPNIILNGKNDKGVHSALVLDEVNNIVLLVEITHSKKTHNKNNYPIRNLNSKDIDENGDLRESYIVKKVISSYKNKKTIIINGINTSALKKQINDLYFTDWKKREILDILSDLTTLEEKYFEFIKLAEKEKKNG